MLLESYFDWSSVNMQKKKLVKNKLELDKTILSVLCTCVCAYVVLQLLDRCTIFNGLSFYWFTILSIYPDRRVKTDDKGRNMGVIGSVSLLQNVTLTSQPISCLDWSPDKVHSCPVGFLKTTATSFVL